MSFRPSVLLFASLSTAMLLLAGARPSTAMAAVVRCQLPDGTTLYTDRRCNDAGAIPQSVPARRGAAPIGCARNLQDLLLRISSAIDNRDTNRLASVYHWTGTSGSRSKVVMKRLDRLAQRPLIGVVPVMAGAPADTSADYYPSSDAGDYQTPVAVRIEQTLDNGITPSNTVFGLHRYFGCLWIHG
ncbi:MAG: hypothetical protein ACOH1P_02555 [Lysobacter sp.]